MSDVSEVNLSAPTAPEAAPVAAPEPVADQPISPEVESPKTEDENKWAQRFAALARREKEISRKAQEAKLALENEDFKAYTAAKQAKNPIQALQSLGMSFQDAAQYVLNDNKAPEATIEDQVRELKAQISKAEEDRLAREESAKTEYIEQTIDNHKKSIGQYIQDNSDKYELIAANDAQETVFDVIQEFYNKNSRVLSIEEASDKVEDYLTEKAKSLFALKKFQGQFSPVPPPQAEIPTTPPTDTRPKPGMTLTNTAVTAQPQKENLGLLSRDESIKRAAALIRFK